MKLGMPQLFEFDTIEENLGLAKSLGLDFVELNLNFGYCRKEMEEGHLKQLFEKYGLLATLHFFDEADFASYPPVVKGYMELLEQYLKLGEGWIKQLNVHLNVGPVVTIAGEKNYLYEKEFDSYIVTLIKNLHEVQNACQRHGVNLVIENTDTLVPYVKKTYPYLVREGFRFCYDVGHDSLCNDLIWEIQQELPMRFGEFHIHDAKDRKKCHLALGEGELDIAKFKRLAERNDAFVVLEVKQKSDLETSVPLFRSL